MLIADFTLTTESTVVIGGLMAVLAGVISKLYLQVIATKDEALKEMTSQRNSYKEISSEAVGNLEIAAHAKLVSKGEPKPAIVAPVIPEHSSPATQKQQDAADLQTMRARIVAATLQLDLPPKLASRPMNPEEEEK